MNESELQELEEQALRDMRWGHKWYSVVFMLGVLSIVGFGYLTFELLSSIGPIVNAWFGV